MMREKPNSNSNSNIAPVPAATDRSLAILNAEENETFIATERTSAGVGTQG